MCHAAARPTICRGGYVGRARRAFDVRRTLAYPPYDSPR
jgi:hypothetical protein